MAIKWIGAQLAPAYILALAFRLQRNSSKIQIKILQEFLLKKQDFNYGLFLLYY